MSRFYGEQLFRVDVEFHNGMDEVTARQAPYAVSQALNRTANEIQKAVRARVHRVFTVRKPTFIDRLVKIRPDERATKEQLTATVRIEGPERVTGPSLSAAAILIRHESGGPHQALDPTRPFFVPSDALRPSPSTLVPRRLYPRALGLADRKGIQGETIAGKMGAVKRSQGQTRRYFVIPEYGIFEREGPNEIQKVWHYTRRVRLRPQLQFMETAKGTATKRLSVNMRDAWLQALRTARLPR